LSGDGPAPEERLVVSLALGRLFRMLSRPAQPGDVEEYYRLRAILLDALDPDGDAHRALREQDAERAWARARLRGAAGDRE